MSSDFIVRRSACLARMVAAAATVSAYDSSSPASAMRAFIETRYRSPMSSRAMRYRVSMDARIALAGELESYADTVAAAATILARHADRRTIKSEDVEAYYELEPYFE